MFEAEKELMRFYRDGLSQILNGVILRNKTISRAGKSSAVIFVPSYLLGQKVKIVIIPENTEVAGLRQTLDKKHKKISRLTNQLKKLNSEATNLESDIDSESDTENSEEPVDNSLEDDDSY